MQPMPGELTPVPRPSPLDALVEIVRWRRILATSVTKSPHETRAAGILRPVVFGGNDGLVSNLALVMGVAGAAPAPGIIVLAGVAGRLARAFSMAVGEYSSVRSQRELLEYQVEFQKQQLRDTPDQ